MAEPLHKASEPPDQSLGVIVHRLSEQIPDLVRSELRLAQAELTQKGKAARLGVGLFSAAGLLGLFAFGTLIAAAILALSLALPAWAAALVVAGALLISAGVAALAGKKEVAGATPAKPQRALTGFKQDVATLKGGHG
jgi:uncharacterized membrane protein YqjE